MHSKQILAIVAAVLLFCILFFGLSNKPPKSAEIERSRLSSTVDSKIFSLLKRSKENLTPSDRDLILLLQQEVERTEEDSAKVEPLKRLASAWYRLGNPSISGHYAEKIAEILNSEVSWSMAGSTFGLSLAEEPDYENKEYRRERAVFSFENAISLNPENIDNRINLALTYVEYPLAEQPMKGIQMLLALNKEEPENPDVLFHLGRLAIQTGQFERAEGRLKSAEKLNPEDVRIVCALADLYEKTANVESEKYREACMALLSERPND
jgi:tetratricopeptide (TPR) repeat protein